MPCKMVPVLCNITCSVMHDACFACVQAAQSVSTVSNSAVASVSNALQPLRDHHAITPNVLGALHTRERQLLTVMTLRQDLEDKRARLSAAQLTPASQAKRVCDFVRTAWMRRIDPRMMVFCHGDAASCMWHTVSAHHKSIGQQLHRGNSCSTCSVP